MPAEAVVEKRCPVYGLIVLFLAHTGLPATELADLEIRDIDLARAHGPG